MINYQPRHKSDNKNQRFSVSFSFAHHRAVVGVMSVILAAALLGAFCCACSGEKEQFLYPESSQATEDTAAADTADTVDTETESDVTDTDAAEVSDVSEASETEEIDLWGDKTGVYRKLHDGENINVLIVGDSIGAGTGASDDAHKWSNLLAEYLSSKYGISVTTTNISMSGNTSYAGYSRVMMLDEGIDYDLAVICYGQNDSTTNFSLYYELIVRAISSKYTNCSIISILQSSQKDYTEKIMVIQEICEYYGIPTVDTIEPFQADYDAYSDDGVHPNDTGYAIYAECVENVIDTLVLEGEGFAGYNITPVIAGVSRFNNFMYIGSGDFERTDDVTYTLTGVSVSGVLGIDYCYTNGDNTVEIYADGELLTASTVTYTKDSLPRHIVVLSDESTVSDEITIVFSSSEMADNFQGIIFSWE